MAGIMHHVGQECPDCDGQGSEVSGRRRVAVAFQVATTRSPGARCERPDRGLGELGGERLGGREADADAVADGGDRATSAARRLRAEPGGRRPPARARSPTGGRWPPPAPVAAVGARHLAAAVELHDREPVRAAARGAGEHDGAGEVGHERGARARRRARAARAPLDDRPPSITATRSPSRAASAKSWVTSSAGTRGSRAGPRRARARAARGCARRAPTAARRAAARAARARARGRARRAGARRPTASRGRASARSARPKRSSSSSGARRGARARHPRSP